MTYTRHSDAALAAEGICFGDCQVVLTHCRAKAQYLNIVMVIPTGSDLPE
jgi:hypothetical protein